jgi:hypothetical protein
MEEFAGIWEIVLWALAAVVKFLFIPSAMVARGVDAPTTVVVTTAGAAVGTAVFYYGARATFARLRARRQSAGRAGRKVFTPRRRRIVAIRRRLGLAGILALSGLISVPVAAVLSAKYYPHDPRMPWALMVAFAVWSVALTALSGALDLNRLFLNLLP